MAELGSASDASGLAEVAGRRCPVLAGFDDRKTAAKPGEGSMAGGSADSGEQVGDRRLGMASGDRRRKHWGGGRGRGEGGGEGQGPEHGFDFPLKVELPSPDAAGPAIG
jgi:hypothetical protein